VSERQRTRGGEDRVVSLKGYAVDSRTLRVQVPAFPDSYRSGVCSITASRLYTYKASGADCLQRPLVPRSRFRQQLTGSVRPLKKQWRRYWLKPA
jgi:hypothetical protein